MPTYQYRCAKCGDQFEEWQSIHDDPLKRHRGGCGGKLDKVLSVGGIVLKGSGFYKTDNRSSSKTRAETKSDGASDTKSDSSSGEKSSSNGSGDSKSSSTSKDTKSPTPSKSGASST